ncbi:MAG TPA: glutathione S-transferase N-terminal domain-containing protein [Gammaproteobacteria bacterium]
MGVVTTRRSVMTLFSGASDAYSHRVRIAMAEKDVTVDIVSVDANNAPEDFIDLNPYQTLPTLLDRELVLYTAPIIMEYLDERYPHPPLLPVDPVARANNRLMLYRIEKDLYSLFDLIMAGSDKVAAKARKDLRDQLLVISPVFQQKPFFLSDEFTLVDCTLAPLLWRLPLLGVALPKQAQPLLDYAERLFRRSSFKLSLSEIESEMRR